MATFCENSTTSGICHVGRHPIQLALPKSHENSAAVFVLGREYGESLSRTAVLRYWAHPFLLALSGAGFDVLLNG